MSDKIITLKQTNTGDRLLPKTLKEAIIDLTIDQEYNAESANPQSGTAIASAGFLTHHQDISGKADIADLSAVAFSGSYNDLLNKPLIPDAQVQADWEETDEESKSYIKNKPIIPSGVTVDQIYNNTSTNAQSGTAIAGALISYQLISQPVVSLSLDNNNVILSDNTINKINIDDTAIFILPSISDLTKFHQILVQINMENAQSIDVGTSYYFNEIQPNMSTAGTYNLIYEYDNIAEHWICGCLKKETIGENE